MSRHARRYSVFQRLMESEDCDPQRMTRRTTTRVRWVRVGARAFPLAEAQQYYGSMLTLNKQGPGDLELRAIPREY